MLTDALMPRAVWETYLDGYRAGYVDGIDRGRHLADDEAATLHREAHRVVMAMAKLDPYAEREQRRRRCADEAARRHEDAARPFPDEDTRLTPEQSADIRGWIDQTTATRAWLDMGRRPAQRGMEASQ